MSAEISLSANTMAYCATCGKAHAVQFAVGKDEIIQVTDCPVGPNRMVISQGDDLFAAVQSRLSRGRRTVGANWSREVFDLIEITDKCNFACPLCYAASGPAGRSFMPLPRILFLAQKIVEQGRSRGVSLTGGEPTLHPQLPEIISAIRNETGLSAVVVTNGLRISEDYDYLAALKRSGLRKLQLQFDTLENTTYRTIRGRDSVEEKHRAIEHLCSAGMRFGLIATITRLNLHEVGPLLDFAQTLVPCLRVLVLQPAVPIGRFPTHLETVTREMVIEELVESRSDGSLGPEDFLQLNTPGDDIASFVVLGITGNQAYPLLQPRCASRSAPGLTNSDGFLGSSVLPIDLRYSLRQHRGSHPLCVGINVHGMCYRYGG